MKPDWNEAPHWANYLARDKNGNWYWYEFEPVVLTSFDAWNCAKGRAEVVTPNSHSDWKKTLEPRP